jgi:lysophospholipase L1-like esterase
MRLPTWSLALPLAAFACSSDATKSDTNGTGGATSGSGVGGSGAGSSVVTTGTTVVNGGAGLGGISAVGSNIGGISAGGTTATTTTPIEPCPAPIDLGVHLVGRYDGCVENGVRIGWSGSGFVTEFSGTGLTVRMNDTGQPDYYTVIIDGTLADPILTKAGSNPYTLATGLTSGSHRVELYRRTEASFGPTVLLEVTVEGGQLSEAPKMPERMIEVVGDSITCGYGNLGESSSCSFSSATEDHYQTYGVYLAKRFDAELSTVAWSGRGVVSNYNGEVSYDRMPKLYDRAVPGEKRSLWDFHTKPQAVIINLGTNDYSTDHDPTDADFVSTYVGLLTNIRGHYPDAYILCTVGPMLSGTDLTKARTTIAEAVAVRAASGDNNVEAYDLLTSNDSPGCDYHPNPSTHQAIADELALKLEEHLGW